MIWFWSFLTYSFLGCLLEEAYAAATGGRSGRKGLRVLPLCPVYGAGACLILFVTGGVTAWPPAVFFLGGLAATPTGRAVKAGMSSSKKKQRTLTIKDARWKLEKES